MSSAAKPGHGRGWIPLATLALALILVAVWAVPLLSMRESNRAPAPAPTPAPAPAPAFAPAVAKPRAKPRHTVGDVCYNATEEGDDAGFMACVRPTAVTGTLRSTRSSGLNTPTRSATARLGRRSGGGSVRDKRTQGRPPGPIPSLHKIRAMAVTCSL
jgi:hypothetical protein